MASGKFIFKGKGVGIKVLRRAVILLAAGFGCFLLYVYLYTNVLGLTLPKTLILRHRNNELRAACSLVERDLASCSRKLENIHERDNAVYRPVFGMDPVPEDLFSDDCMQQAFVQSTSFDEVMKQARRSDEMAMCVPCINPVDMNLPWVSISSPFGYRFHPIYQRTTFHRGIDIKGHKGDAIFATGSGVVESATLNFHGYGNCVVIDHGFGYKTRYAHLQTFSVHKGQAVKRGEQIARLGNSGRSTGSHLHYEVIYRGNNVNPWNYLSDDISGAEEELLSNPE